MDLFEIKAEVEVLAATHRVDLGARMVYEFEVRTGGFCYLHQRDLVIEGGIVAPRAAAHYDLDQPVWYAVVDLRAFYEARSRRTGFKSVPDYPASKRDLSLVTPPGVAYSQIEKSLVKHGGRLLESVQVFDVYRGGSLPDGSTAYGVRLCFRSAGGTLRDTEVEAVVVKVIDKLRSELGVALRK
jgi:phenylalanyl-tRNA synthetase beta chain